VAASSESPRGIGNYSIIPGGVWTPTEDARDGCVSSSIPGSPSENSCRTTKSGQLLPRLPQNLMRMLTQSRADGMANNSCSCSPCSRVFAKRVFAKEVPQRNEKDLWTDRL